MQISKINWNKNDPVGYDITDFFNNGKSAEDVKKLINNATPITLEDIHTYQTSHNSEGVEYQHFIPKIDNELLTPALKLFLKAVTEATDAPDEFMLTSVLAHWAGTVGNKIFTDSAKGKLRSNIWTICFADSSVARKSTALSIGGLPFKVVQIQLDLEYNEEQRNFLGIQDEGENLDEDDEIVNTEPNEPAKTRLLLASDFSDAGCYILMKNNPVSGVIVTSEFADFFKKLHRDWTGQATAILAAYDNERMVRVTRKHGEEVIKEPTFSILGATTFASFIKSFSATETENGFLSRIFPVVITTPTKKRKGFLQREMVDNNYSFKLETQITNWVDFDGEIEMIITEKMKKAFTDWEMDFVEKARQKYSDILNPTIERLVPGCLKLAMILQSLEIDDPNGLTELELKQDTLKCAQMLVENVFLPSMSYLFENKIVMTDDAMKEEKIIKIILKNNGVIDRSLLRKKSRLSSEDLDTVIDSLVKQYKIRVTVTQIDRGQGGGTPLTHYTLVRD